MNSFRIIGIRILQGCMQSCNSRNAEYEVYVVLCILVGMVALECNDKMIREMKKFNKVMKNIGVTRTVVHICTK